MTGKLFLIPTVLQEEALHVIPVYVHEITKTLDLFFVENERTARRYLRSSGYTRSFDEVILYPLNEHTPPEEIAGYVQYLKKGKDAGLMSEAGVPAVADPGQLLVRLAHENGIQVVPLVGPNSILLAIMASGLNGQQFSFHGYLPVKQAERIKKIREMEQRVVKGETQVFIETPYRNQSLINDVLTTCREHTLFCIASELTGKKESIRTKTIGEWKRQPPTLEKVPAIFLIGNFAI